MVRLGERAKDAVVALVLRFIPDLARRLGFDDTPAPVPVFEEWLASLSDEDVRVLTGRLSFQARTAFRAAVMHARNRA